MSNQAARLAACVALLVFGAATDRALAINPNDTRMLAQPAVSERQIAFVYADDLWVANLDGSDAKRLTGRAGEVANPHYSPDGTLIAFSARRDSNADVYVVPASGGEPQRLTWHPLPDAVQGFTPDGKNVLFTSAREVHTNRFSQLFTVPITGGVPTRLPIPNAARATYSPDGAFLAYNPLGDAFRQWKNYRGGRTSRLWLYDSASHDVVEIPQPAGRCNDVDPMWLGGTIYFLSDRSGEFNLFAYDVASKRIEQLTKLDDFPIQAASAGGGRIIYEQGGYLHLFDLKTRESTRLVVSVAAELPELRDRWASGFRWVRNTALSPSGARAAIEFRGEIISVPADKGDPRNLTKTPAAHERSPAWSPDGASIAYLSDAGGEYLLKVEPQDGKGET
jgi:tricorn protease